MKPVDILPGARRDFDESFDWYAERSPQAAERFASAVDIALAEISADPERHATIDERHRQCALSHFPFRIVYRDETRRVVVVAIAHGRRRPGYWKGRT
jgi:plasmid stabilization system protein ParE